MMQPLVSEVGKSEELSCGIVWMKHKTQSTTINLANTLPKQPNQTMMIKQVFDKIQQIHEPYEIYCTKMYKSLIRYSALLLHLQVPDVPQSQSTNQLIVGSLHEQ
jgi:hypothetical protein